MGNPDHPEITLHFLNAVLASGPVIKEVEITNPFLDRKHDLDKLSILDIRATDDRGRLINIEMQTSLAAGLRERLTYYAASLYVGQLSEGHGYTQLNSAIGICVLDSVLFSGKSDFHHDFRLRSHTSGLELTDRLQIHVLELPKYVIPGDNEPIVEPLDQWCYFFRQASLLTASDLCSRLPEPVFEDAARVLEMIARNPRERELYESRLKLQRDEQARLQAARDQGEAKGRIEGELYGKIRLLQSLLGDSEQSMSDLSCLSLDECRSLLSTLQERLRSRDR